MRVIILQQVPHIGEAGDIKEVADGYFRNFLLPKKLAKPATTSSLREVEELREATLKKKEREEIHIQEFVTEASRNPIVILRKANDEGHLFGSVTARDIADAIRKKGFPEITEDCIDLSEAIKLLGTYVVSLRLQNNAKGAISIVIERG